MENLYLFLRPVHSPATQRRAAFFSKRCIVKRRMYQPVFAVYITLGEEYIPKENR
jgi:hypothetical protein